MRRMTKSRRKLSKNGSSASHKLLARCAFCERRFVNKQAVRAHLKACAPYQVTKATRQKPEATASALGMLPMLAADRPHSASDQTENSEHPEINAGTIRSAGHRRGRDSQEHLLCLLDTHEEVVALRNECAHYYRIVRVTASRRCADQAGCAEVAALLHDLHLCERDCYQMVLNSTLDRATLFDLYERGLLLKQVWLGIRHRDALSQELAEDYVPNDESARQIQQEEALVWDSFINKIKRLYVASPRY